MFDQYLVEAIYLILFLIYHIISMTGEKLVKKDILGGFYGIWGPTIYRIYNKLCCFIININL